MNEAPGRPRHKKSNRNSQWTNESFSVISLFHPFVAWIFNEFISFIFCHCFMKISFEMLDFSSHPETNRADILRAMFSLFCLFKAFFARGGKTQNDKHFWGFPGAFLWHFKLQIHMLSARPHLTDRFASPFVCSSLSGPICLRSTPQNKVPQNKVWVVSPPWKNAVMFRRDIFVAWTSHA